MEYRYGLSSTNKLNTCHEILQIIANHALRYSPVDIMIVSGYRSEDEQNTLYKEGKSKLRYPNSKHNTIDPITLKPCSQALDFAPIVRGAAMWNDPYMFAVIFGHMNYAARTLNVKLRWGGDWDMDGTTTDQTFMDWGHVELVL